MDCDDQVWLVKCDDHADSDTLDLPRVTGLSIFIAIEFDRILNESFDISHRCLQASKVVLGMPGEAHAPLSFWHAKLSPSGSDDGGRDQAAADAEERDDRQQPVPGSFLDLRVEGERDEEEGVDQRAEDERDGNRGR